MWSTYWVVIAIVIIITGSYDKLVSSCKLLLFLRLVYTINYMFKYVSSQLVCSSRTRENVVQPRWLFVAKSFIYVVKETWDCSDIQWTWTNSVHPDQRVLRAALYLCLLCLLQSYTFSLNPENVIFPLRNPLSAK